MIPGSVALVTNRQTLADVLLADMEYLARVIQVRLAFYFDQKTTFARPQNVPRPSHKDPRNPYLAFVKEHDLSYDEHTILLIALAPHVQPDFFDRIISNAIPQGGEFPQIGGVRGKQFRGFLPTGETAIFILAGDDLDRRFAVQQLFSEDHVFARQQVLKVERSQPGEPAMSGKLVMDPEFVDLFTLGQVSRPRFCMEFPAQRVSTEMIWDELVLPERTLQQIRELHIWLQHGDTLLYKWGMQRKLKRGYTVLFHGPPGTGKTLTACLLGKTTRRDVYRIDLSMVVSKFIGETEKNLANLFDKADNKDWILFFDEADALFSKRTTVRDAHDKYANQEVAYLLQRIETYGGLVILASNFKSNIDEAFMRRFQAAIHFPTPRISERLQLWSHAFPDTVKLDKDVHLDEVARKYELTGAHIMNVVQYTCLRALDRGDHKIMAVDIETGTQREIGKEGKVQ
jgi:AAA+ superfamily predicted ATPase